MKPRLYRQATSLQFIQSLDDDKSSYTQLRHAFKNSAEWGVGPKCVWLVKLGSLIIAASAAMVNNVKNEHRLQVKADNRLSTTIHRVSKTSHLRLAIILTYTIRLRQFLAEVLLRT